MLHMMHHCFCGACFHAIPGHGIRQCTTSFVHQNAPCYQPHQTALCCGMYCVTRVCDTRTWQNPKPHFLLHHLMLRPPGMACCSWSLPGPLRGSSAPTTGTTRSPGAWACQSSAPSWPALTSSTTSSMTQVCVGRGGEELESRMHRSRVGRNQRSAHLGLCQRYLNCCCKLAGCDIADHSIVPLGGCVH